MVQNHEFIRNQKEVDVMKLYFVRHGKTVYNADRRVQGWSDSPLTKEGYQAACDTGRGLAGIAFDHAYASDLVRAADTAMAILAYNNAARKPELIQLRGLREMCFGKYEGGPEDALLEAGYQGLGVSGYSEWFAMENANEKLYRAIAGTDETGEAEDYEDFVRRQCETVLALAEEAAQDGGKHVLIVTHGAALAALLARMGGVPENGVVPNASVSIVEFSKGGFRVEKIGEESYTRWGATIRGKKG
jgi:probable phosphoglycerate mutase